MIISPSPGDVVGTAIGRAGKVVQASSMQLSAVSDILGSNS
jgi:hypothetical protein